MSMPGFTADVSASRGVAPPATGSAPFAEGELVLAAWQGDLVPQFAVCTPCLGLPAGNWCFSVLGRRICVPIPNIGRWKGCCDVSVWPPGIRNCGVRRC